jgi:hypothetical protein
MNYRNNQGSRKAAKDAESSVILLQGCSSSQIRDSAFLSQKTIFGRPSYLIAK